MANKLEVYCTISNCHYWKNGNYCDANEILVTNDKLASSEPDRLDAPQASTLEHTPVGQCMDTCCKTFVPSGSGKENVDGVYRA